MKFIDAEKLIAEIGRLGRNWDGEQELQPASLFQADLYELLSIIDSLQQEHEEMEFSFKGGTYRVNGEEKPFKGGKAKVIILELISEEE